ncbi:MAG: GNAT family N-acetyltransferase [Opitutales bacterium]|nr:GNAT family N-acetyltransferase [Opitutales bacterium]
MNISLIQTLRDLPEWISVDSLTGFLHTHLKPYEDTPQDIRKGLDYALSDEPGKGGFVLIAHEGSNIQGALVMLKTGMEGFVPGNLLLFIAVHNDLRGKGIGGRLIGEAKQHADGDVCLHVEYDNPAKRLYERSGFSTKYAEMRFKR